MISDLPMAAWQAEHVSTTPHQIWRLGRQITRQEWLQVDCQQRHLEGSLWLCLQSDALWIYQQQWQHYWLSKIPLKDDLPATQLRHWLGEPLLHNAGDTLTLQLYETLWSVQQLLAQIQFRYRQRMTRQPQFGGRQLVVELSHPHEYWFVQAQSTGTTVLRVTYAE